MNPRFKPGAVVRPIAALAGVHDGTVRRWRDLGVDLARLKAWFLAQGELLTAAEAGRRLGMTPYAVRRLMARGQLRPVFFRAYTMRRLVRIPVRAVREFEKSEQ